ncbi:MAG: hypothetical protein ACFBQW_08535 [Sphingomonadaceae bacterium]
MLKAMMISALAIGAAGCVADAERSAELTPEGEAELAAALAGKVAQEPRSCVSLRDLRGNKSIADRYILFEGRGDEVYLSRASGGCDISPWEAIEVRTTGTQLCEGEAVRVFDPRTGMFAGSCILGEFTPYRDEG